MKLAWLTNLHLIFLDPGGVDAFIRSVAETDADAFLLSGDIGEADDVAHHLNALDTAVQRPLYFVLGNHDFYRGSIAGVRDTVRQLCRACPGHRYLPDAGVVGLTAETCLVGHDGWGSDGSRATPGRRRAQAFTPLRYTRLFAVRCKRGNVVAGGLLLN